MLFFPLFSSSLSLRYFLASGLCLGEGDGLRVAKVSDPLVLVDGPHGEVVLVAALELSQRARHRQRKRLHVANLLPQRRCRSGAPLLREGRKNSAHSFIVRFNGLEQIRKGAKICSGNESCISVPGMRRSGRWPPRRGKGAFPCSTRGRYLRSKKLLGK